jgi:transcriptional regulator with XRE-family HTH domain
MDVQQAMRAMVDASGMTHRQISARLGRYDSYVSQLLTRTSVPGADTVASIARACGYRLELVPMRGGAPLVIGDDGDDAPDRDMTIAKTKELLTKALANLDAMESD